MAENDKIIPDPREPERLVGEDKTSPGLWEALSLHISVYLLLSRSSAQLAKWAWEQVYSMSSVMERCIRCPGARGQAPAEMSRVMMDPENSAEGKLE